MDISNINELHSLAQISVSPLCLFLDPNNPRISVSEDDDKIYTPEEIISDTVQNSVLERIHKDQNHIPEMKNKILNSGFLEGVGPFIVKEILPGKYIVLEGNRRLTAIKEILGDTEGVKDFVLSSLQEIQVRKFEFKENSDFEEDEVIDMLLSRIHIDGPLGWGAMEKAKYIYKSYERELRKYLGRDIDDSNFDLVNSVISIVSDINSFKPAEVSKNLLVYRVFRQLRDCRYDVDTKRFTLIELATSDSALTGGYFELGSNFLFSAKGLERFYQLCVTKGAPVSNPQEFKKFSYIFKKGNENDRLRVVNKDASVSEVHIAVKSREGEDRVLRSLTEISEKIGNLNFSGFLGDREEAIVIQRIVDLVNNKLAVMLEESFKDGQEILDEIDWPTDASSALGCKGAEIQLFIRLTLQGRANRTCLAKDLAPAVIKFLGIYTSGEPRKKLLNKINTEIDHLEKYRLIERYNGNKRFRLLTEIPTLEVT